MGGHRRRSQYRAVHAYFAVEWPIVWVAAIQDTPELRRRSPVYWPGNTLTLLDLAIDDRPSRAYPSAPMRQQVGAASAAGGVRALNYPR